jgi:CheY-like chemotaxis protein/nitrogen-specific signal transduction histidine kinase
MKQKSFAEDIETYAQDIVDTVREPLLMLDATLRVRSANRAFYQTFQVSAEETENRLIYELGNGQWNIPALRTLLEDIIPMSSVFNDFELEHTFPIIGRRVMLLNGRKLRPGSHTKLLVLAMEDVTERRRSEANLKAMKTYAQNIVDTVREPLLILDTTLRVRSANRAFYQTFQVSLEETENRLVYELGNGQWDIPVLRTLLEDIVPLSSVFNDFEWEHDFPAIGRRVMLLNARKLQAGHHGELLVLAMEDVTERRRAEKAVAKETAEIVKRTKSQFPATRSHELEMADEAASTTIRPTAAKEAAGAGTVISSLQEGDEEDTVPLPPTASCVLVIHDDRTQRDLIRRYLSREGFCVRGAASGEAGLRLARQLLPIAITLDVRMHGMDDGWSVLLALKADPNLCDIPVIMMTMESVLESGFTLGATDIATKPVDRARLSQIVKKYACPHPPCSVLLVEDNLVTRELTRRILEKEGWKVSEAENGRVALERMERERPKLILLDLMMPEMDGFEFAVRVRQNLKWRLIPIVVLTARDLSGDERRRLNGYVETILHKAGDSREALLHQLRDLLHDYTVPHAARFV